MRLHEQTAAIIPTGEDEKMKEIRRQIKEKDFHKVYLLTGDESYLDRKSVV